ncbi:MAG: preprotein translocase subunit SecD [Methanomicrobiales archaeon]|nr:preprotein translocase subunit SecD [Methanomicrobiales archaeon]NYT20264.1 preprotein translocase subunit SecD [Methanomicrobiales archaeon]
MNRKEFIELFKNWQVALLVVLLIASVFFIYPHVQDGKLATNLQYGLDFTDGTWLQMEFQAEVIGFETTRPVTDFLTDLRTEIDAEMYLVDDNRLEIRKYVSEAELRQIVAAAGGSLTSYEQGVSRATGEQVKEILEQKLNALGTRDAKVNPLTSLSGITRYVRVELAGVSLSQAKDIVGKQGRFEIRIHTTGNETEHVLYGDTITTVGIPTQEPPGSDRWGVSFTLSEEGAAQFRDAAIRYGATTDPESHWLDMILDDVVVYSAPLSQDLASQVQAGPIRQLFASTGPGQEGLNAAKNLEIHLRAGALPVEVTVAGSGSVSAPLGEYFKTMSVLAFIVAALAVGVVIFYRYREPAIVLPMIGINLSEIVILLGIAALIQQQLDLLAIAALIAVLGTGIDQLVIITDEVLHEGKVPSPHLYQKRLTRAVGIIMVSAATVIIAMIPLALMDLSTLRGFAIITIIGVLVGVLVTRPAYGKIIMAILSK